MTKLNPAELTICDRLYPTLVARKICEKMYGGKISEDTWTRWRSWGNIEEASLIPKIPFGAKHLNYAQITYLAAVAYIRQLEKVNGSKPRGLDETKIHETMFNPKLVEVVDGLLQSFLAPNQGYITGYEAIHVLKLPEHKLKKLKQFSTKKMYDPELLEFYITHK
jgi:hypothetical protein